LFIIEHLYRETVNKSGFGMLECPFFQIYISTNNSSWTSVFNTFMRDDGCGAARIFFSWKVDSICSPVKVLDFV
jgi:hypothetical protein